MTTEESSLQISVDHLKYYAKGTWKRYKELGIWGKVSSIPRLRVLGRRCSRVVYSANELVWGAVVIRLVSGCFLHRAGRSLHPQGRSNCAGHVRLGSEA